MIYLLARSFYEKDEQDWKTLTTYHAKTTIQEKVYRLANGIVFGTALYGACASLTGPMALLSYAAKGLAVRKIVSLVIGYGVYPAAVTSFPCTVGDHYQQVAKKQIATLERLDYFVKKISVYKSGTRYDAAVIAHSSTINNGKWTIQALGNGMMMEPFMLPLAARNFGMESNTLLINGPSVSESGGWPTRYQMGAGFEAGLQLLEQEIKATHIAMRGLSLGGGMMAEAILNHDFTEGMKRGISYLSISDRTFSRLSTIAEHLVGSVVKPIFYLTNTELDGIGAARTLSQLGISHIIIQHSSHNAKGSDKVIPDAVSLAHEVHQEEGLSNKIFLESDKVVHNGELPDDIERRLKQELDRFFQNK